MIRDIKHQVILKMGVCSQEVGNQRSVAPVLLNRFYLRDKFIVAGN